MSDRISVDLLFKTEALVVSPPNEPFIYTSGLIGPYYINTHYLCGGKQRAEKFLSFIDERAEKDGFIDEMFALLLGLYEEDEIFRQVSDAIAEQVRNMNNFSSIRYVSGGQRRDWFFAPMTAHLLEKPFLAIYNDGRVYDRAGATVESLELSEVVNVADLLTVGSSYVKKWVPAISEKNGKLTSALNVVDRCQGGSEELESVGVSSQSFLFKIDKQFILEAHELGCIDEKQRDLVLNYLGDRHVSMKDFLKANPDYIKALLEGDDEKKRKRAKLLVEQDLYSLT